MIFIAVKTVNTRKILMELLREGIVRNVLKQCCAAYTTRDKRHEREIPRQNFSVATL